jgi:hypothetical protein
MKPRPCRVQPRLSDARWGALAFNPKAFGWEVKRTRRCLPALKSSVAFVILVTELPPFAASVRRKRFREDFSYGNANQNHPDWSRFDTTSLSVVRGRRRLSLRGATQNVAWRPVKQMLNIGVIARTKMRALAETVQEVETIAIMHRLADDYDKLADRATPSRLIVLSLRLDKCRARADVCLRRVQAVGSWSTPCLTATGCVDGHSDAPVHQSTTSHDFMPRAAQLDRRDRLLYAFGEIRINRRREPPPKPFRL